jgi:cell wall-associated NlpC family hydrolase
MMTKGAHYPGLRGSAPRLWTLALVAALAACGGGERVRHAPPVARAWPQVPPADPAAANAVLMRALGLVGTPYRYGGNTPEGGFDCSGLVNYVYGDMTGLRLPRSSRELAAIQGPKLTPDRLAPADLVFFGSRGQVTHVGIYVGEGRFVHAPSTGGTVRLDRLDGPYWRERYSGAKRVLAGK